MNHLAQMLHAQGDLAGGARKLQEDTLTVKRCVLGPEHSSTTISAWNLFQTLQDLGERAAALAIPERDLLWLLDRDPATLGPTSARFARTWCGTSRRVDSARRGVVGSRELG